MKPNQNHPWPQRRAAHQLSCLRVRHAAVVALSLTVAQVAAQQGAGTASETTLPLESTVTVDLHTAQSNAEQAAALERARIVAAARGSREPVRSIPEVDLIARDVLHDFPAIPARFEGAEAGWRVRSATPPEFYAQRIIARLLRAGFSSVPRCPGEEWSGLRGASRVALRLEDRAVAVLLGSVSTSCPGAGEP